jgi:hypothetical protein
MNSIDNILKELEELSPTLAAVPRLNVFSVPEGYFDNLRGELILKVYTADDNEFQQKMSASVPEGYFDNLAGNILARIKSLEVEDGVSEETSAISAVVGKIGNKNLFQAPVGYFENLTANILELVNDTVAGESVMEETASISAVVAGLGNKNVFSVPVGFFEQLNIRPGIEDKKPAKLVTMTPRSNVFRYAAAAVVTGIVAISAFFILDNQNKVGSAEGLTAMAEAKQILKTNSFDEKLASVSDEAIVNFLESKGQDVEAALVASLSDNKNLPSTTDYLLNDEMLDEVLKTLDLNN